MPSSWKPTAMATHNQSCLRSMFCRSSSEDFPGPALHEEEAAEQNSNIHSSEDLKTSVPDGDFNPVYADSD